MQATENFIDKKNQAELIELMNKLFDDRARAIRAFMVELFKSKNAELASIKAEFEPQRTIIRNKHKKGLLN